MTHKIISNSTPLIALSKINRLHIIKELFGAITIPKAVYREVVSDSKGRAGKNEVASASWITTKEVKNKLAIELLAVNVDLGEAEAIALAKELDADLLLIDDKAGRKTAQSVGIPIAGTVGLLLRYFRANRDEFKMVLDELVAKGFRIGRKEYDKMLKLSESG